MAVPIYAVEEVSPLLLELARAYRAHCHYPPGTPALRRALSRTTRVWASGLWRGTLRLELREGLLALARGPVICGAGIDELAHELARREVLGVSFSADLRESEIEALIEGLSLECHGAAPSETLTRTLREAGAKGLTVEVRPERGIAEAPPRDSPPTDPGTRQGPVPEPRVASPDESPSDDLFDRASPPPETASRLDSQARGAEPASELAQWLQELEVCSNPALYASCVVRVAESAEKLVYRGQPGGAYEGLLVLAQHASSRDRAPSMREAAREQVRRLLSKDVLLQGVLEQMSSDSAIANVKAAELLLLCGRGVVSELLEVHNRADTGIREHIHAALVTMGDVAFPVLIEELSSSQAPRVRRSARILGDMQHPRGVEFLVAHLRDSEQSICKEVAMALTRIGTRRAIDGLLELLSEGDDERAQIAAAALGATRSDRAGQALTELAGSRQKRSDPLRREAIRSLGRMQWPEAVPVLEKLLRKRGLLHRKQRRRLGMAAIHALRRIGGEAAFGALQDASMRGDSALRHPCAEALRLMGQMTSHPPR